MRHDIKHHIIGSSHCIGTDARKVVDALIHIIIYDTLAEVTHLPSIERRAERRSGADT